MPCLNINPATFKKRVTLQAVSRTPDGQGGFTESWDDTATVWAAVEPFKGYERPQAMQTQTPITHRVTMRYREVTTAQRLLLGTRVFDIKEVLNVNEANAFLKLLCVETARPAGWDGIDVDWDDIDQGWEYVA